jgi:hypothetical protein
MSKFAFIALGLLLTPAPVLAQIVFDDSPPAQAKAQPKKKSDVDKIECRTQDTLGSRLQAHQVCMTKQQWATYELDSKLKVHEMQDIGLNASH